MSLRDELQTIHDTMGGLIPPVVAATVRDNPDVYPAAHSYIWSATDDEAAWEWRVHLTKEAIRSVTITVKVPDRPPRSERVYRPVPAPDSRQPVYRDMRDVVRDPVATEVVLAAMRREVEILKSRYGHLVEFVAILRQEFGLEDEEQRA